SPRCAPASPRSFIARRSADRRRETGAADGGSGRSATCPVRSGVGASLGPPAAASAKGGDHAGPDAAINGAGPESIRQGIRRRSGGVLLVCIPNCEAHQRYEPFIGRNWSLSPTLDGGA